MESGGFHGSDSAQIMDAETEVSQWWGSHRNLYSPAIAERFDWLIAEVERLTAERDLFKKETVALAKDALQFKSVFKEVSGCHTDHGTPKLCDGCLISIASVMDDEAAEAVRP